ncbi:lysozyme inhibitor LprI family protein [Hydrogenophaga sp. 5NK40-0174]|uniref:lysozyme inhibitor LprI family protein n=1 Tax=Hydrogenophaga sp. 5NK40-0174 TaxID=3127649 RepID=UPI003342BD3A
MAGFNQKNKAPDRRLHLAHPLWCVCMAALLASGSAAAGDLDTSTGPDGPVEEFSADYFACQDEARGMAPAMQKCVDAELVLQQRHMNDALGRLQQQLDQRSVSLLQASQAHWADYKNSTCSFHHRVNKSAMAPLEVAACHLDATMERAALLRHWQR